jgi:hypothetical protein
MDLNLKFTLLLILFLFVVVFYIVVTYKQLKNQRNNVNSEDAFQLFMKMSPFRWLIYTFFLKEKFNGKKYNSTSKKDD